jgi:hypothetical protein
MAARNAMTVQVLLGAAEDQSWFGTVIVMAAGPDDATVKAPAHAGQLSDGTYRREWRGIGWVWVRIKDGPGHDTADGLGAGEPARPSPALSRAAGRRPWLNRTRSSPRCSPGRLAAHGRMASAKGS